MTLCLACRGEGSEQAAKVPPPAPLQRGSEGTAALLIRVWDDDGVRGRLLGLRDAGASPVPVGAAHGIDGICAAVRAWLVDITGAGTPPD